MPFRIKDRLISHQHANLVYFHHTYAFEPDPLLEQPRILSSGCPSQQMPLVNFSVSNSRHHVVKFYC